MRKSVKTVAVWPSNGAAYPPRARGYPDSVNSPFYRQFSTQPCELQQARTCHGQYSAILPSRTHRLRKFDQRFRVRVPTSQFSACTPKRSDEEEEIEGFDEEDEEDILISSSDMSRMVRQRGKMMEARARQKREQEQALMRRRLELQSRADQYFDELQNAIVLLQELRHNFESIRRHAEERKRAYEKWMKHYEEVMTSSASSVNEASQIFEEVFLIKYPIVGKTDLFINKNAMFIQHGEAEVSNCRQALRRIRLASQRIDSEMRLAEFEASLGLIARRLSDYHVTPAASAKRNIERILKPLLRFHSIYIQLQDLGYKIKMSNHNIALALKELAAKRLRGAWRLEMFSKDLVTGSNKLTQTLHEYRANERAYRWNGPLGKSHIIAIIQNYYHPSTIGMLASDIKMDPKLLANEINNHGISSLLVHWYLYRWKEGAPRSVDLDIAWRHFDVYYPFYMLYVSSRSLGSEVFRLQKIWKTMGASRSNSEAHFKQWKAKSNVLQSNYLGAVEASSYCTWIRLETEEKVTRLGEVPYTIAKGLFTPKNPVSLDLRRFFLCIDAICDGVSRAMNLDMASVAFANKSQRTISDVIELLDHSPSHKREIGKSQQPLPSEANTQEQPVSLEEELKEETLEDEKHEEETYEEETGAEELEEETYECETHKEEIPEEESTQEANAMATPVQARFTRIIPRWTPSQSRGYCTYSSTLMDDNERQCGVPEPEIAFIQKDPIVELANKDAVISLAFDAEPPGKMDQVLLENTDEPSVVRTDDTKPQFWSYNQYKTPGGGKIGIHYCKNLEHAERAAALFSDSKLLGFDIEWKPQAQISAGIKSNVSLIQIANEERIALFHIALFKGNEIHDLVPPSLKRLLESTDVVKVGVSIKADCSRVRRHLDVDTKGQFELSHLYKLVKYGSTQPKLVDRRAVNLAQQVEELLGLPLRKDSDVRKSDWTKPLDYAQVQYAASDAYACICLHRALEAKRKALNPVPPLPAFAELNLPILLAEEDQVEIEDKVAALSVRMKESLKVVDAGEEDVVEVEGERE